jgi:predicted ATPase
VRHLENLDIELSETERKHLIITGKNGSGKTSLLEVMRGYFMFPFSISYGSGQPYLANPIDDIPFSSTVLQRKQNAEMKKKLQQFENTKIQIFYHTPDNRGWHDTFAVFFPAERTTTTISNPTAIEKVEIKDTYSIEEEASVDFLKYLVYLDYQQLSAIRENNTHEADKIQKWFEKFVQILEDIFETRNVQFRNNSKSLSFEIVIPEHNPARLNELAAGYSAILKIVMELMLRMENKASLTYDISGVVLIDEIETHLHVGLQKKALPFLTKMFPNIQFIVTTHSPFVISSLKNAVIYDLETHERFEDLSAYSYKGIVEYYYNQDLYSDEIKTKFKRYKDLIENTGRDDSESKELAEIIVYLKQIPAAAAPELILAFQNMESQRRMKVNG